MIEINWEEFKIFAETFNHFFRRSDTVCRVDNDCFSVITPDDTSDNIHKLPELLLHRLNSNYTNNLASMEIRIGVATYNKDSSIGVLEEAKQSMKSSDILTVGGAL